jgi:hypothetical protein
VTLSKRHHYLPEFYIKGFVGIDGKVSVYNKNKGKIENGRKSPKQIFFEWNRNTFELQGKKTDFVEGLHRFGENQFAPTYKKLIKNLDGIALTAYDVFQLMLFISTIYRRIPSQDESAIEYIKNLKQENSFFGIRNKNTGENAPIEMFERIINEPSFMESSKIMRSMEDYFKVNRVETAKNWKLSYSPKNSPQLHLLSDNPLIIEGNSKNELLNRISIFPLSKGTTVYNTCNKIVNKVSPESTIYVDILTFIQAENLVCGPDKEYLKIISEFAKEYDTERKIELLKWKVFEIFE